MFKYRFYRLVIVIIFFAGNIYGQDSEELTRKFDVSAFFKSVAKTCEKAGAVAEAKTKEEKQQAACQLAGSVCESVAVLSEKTKTRSLGYEYIQALCALPTDKEKEAYIAEIVTNKDGGFFILDEIFALFKVLLIEELPFLIDKIHQDTVKKLNFDEK